MTINYNAKCRIIVQNVELEMQNYNAECRIRNAECRICCEQIRHMCKNAELVQNRTECKIRTEQNRKQNEKIANRIQN